MTNGNKKSIGDMKAELEAEGYSYAPQSTYVAPNGRTFFDGINLEHSIELAYRHLQERRELEALRWLALSLPSVESARKLVKQFNITADDIEGDEV